MAPFRTKPLIIEATQWHMPGDHPAVFTVPAKVGTGTVNLVKGRQGLVLVDPGDWIIREANGDGFYPCKPDVFEAKYEPLSGQIFEQAEKNKADPLGAAP